MIFKYLNELLLMILKDQITTIFIQVDDFCKEFDSQIKKMKLQALGDHKKKKKQSLINV
jgi:hypothetical protein